MYRAVKSLTDYLLIAQNQALIEHFVRKPNGHWMLSDYRGMEAIRYRSHRSTGPCRWPTSTTRSSSTKNLRCLWLRRIKEPEAHYITGTCLRRPGDPRTATR